MNAFLFDPCNEAVSLRAHGLKVAMGGRVIAQSLSQAGHRLMECRFADHRVTPNSVHQLLVGDELVVVGNQVDEEFQYYWIEVNFLPGPG